MKTRTNSGSNIAGSCLIAEEGFFASASWVWPTLTLIAALSTNRVGSAPVTLAWQEKVTQITWVAYSPTGANPQKRIEASSQSIHDDLALLLKANFNGIVTYGCGGRMGKELPAIAEALGFHGLIMGIWNPTNASELKTARASASNSIVLGYCVGNEGYSKRYSPRDLASAMASLREATGKPVTTAEELEDYKDEELLRLGDWVFPNVHPFFHRVMEPKAAAEWTVAAFKDLRDRGNRFVMIKETGFPTKGDEQGKLSETRQEDYYIELAKADVRFVYFEAFDQDWKAHLPSEPHWGIFRSNRAPKTLGFRLLSLTSTPKDEAAKKRTGL